MIPFLLKILTPVIATVIAIVSGFYHFPFSKYNENKSNLPNIFSMEDRRDWIEAYVIASLIVVTLFVILHTSYGLYSNTDPYANLYELEEGWEPLFLLNFLFLRKLHINYILNKL